MADKEPAQNRGDYFTLIVSLAVVCFCVFASTAILRGPITQFFTTIEETISSLGGK